MYTFGFNGSTVYADELNINELGQVCLEAMDEDVMCYYLIIRTSLGQSSILEYGPLVPDTTILPSQTEIKFQRIDFNDTKIKMIINNFLRPRNKGKSKIVTVSEIDISDAIGRGINILEYMKDFGDTTNY